MESTSVILKILEKFYSTLRISFHSSNVFCIIFYYHYYLLLATNNELKHIDISVCQQITVDDGSSY